MIFVGLDGADWQLLDRYAAAGAMPNLARLVAEGAGGVLETIHPPLSPIVWTSMMTGVSPRRAPHPRLHALLPRERPEGADHERRAASAARSGTWRATRGRTSATFGLWATYPAERVFGLLVSDRLMGFLFPEENPPAGIVYPGRARGVGARDARRRREGDRLRRAARLPALAQRGRVPEASRRAQESDPYAHPVSALRRILIETELYHRLATDWIAKEQPDLAIVYLQGTDSIGHVFAPFAPPRQAAHRGAGLRALPRGP